MSYLVQCMSCVFVSSVAQPVDASFEWLKPTSHHDNPLAQSNLSWSSKYHMTPGQVKLNSDKWKF